MTQKERLSLFINHLGISVRQFEKEIGVSYGAVGHSKGKISSNIIERTCNTFNTINRLWLISGMGEMLKVQLSGDTNVDVDMSEGKRENSGSGNYFEGADAATIRLQLENEHLKADIEKLKADLEKSEAERKDLLKKLLNL